ncbi:MAG TPA: hypothetical protein VFM12_04885 [Gemmatimonadales bacterium]|nr:hypothetical protein [Gemmatimonadales bacterium]
MISSIWRRHGGDADGSSAIALTDAREELRLYLADGLVTGRIAVDGRLSDHVNRASSLRICVADGDGPDELWIDIDRDDILIVAPPPRPTNEARRVRRQRERVLIEVGAYTVTGTTHLPPGAALEPYLLRTRQHFLPVTQAVVRSSVLPNFEETLAIALVNVGNLDHLQRLLAPA